MGVGVLEGGGGYELLNLEALQNLRQTSYTFFERWIFIQVQILKIDSLQDLRQRFINLLWHSDAISCCVTWPPLDQLVAHVFLVTKPSSEPSIWTVRKKIRWNLNKKYILFHKHEFENIDCKLWAIFFRFQCVVMQSRGFGIVWDSPLRRLEVHQNLT